MKEKLVIFVLYALLSSSNCIKVVDSENATTTIDPLDGELKSENVSEAQVTEINCDDAVTTPSFIKIPPTLQNVKTTKIPFNQKENLTPASVHKNIQIIPDGKLKQAILHSKIQNFKNIMEKSNVKVRDQVRLEARPNVQTEATLIQPEITPPAPTAKEFIPSPELNSFHMPQSRHQDLFHPMNQHQRTPIKHDAHFHQENYFANPIIDSKWLGSQRSAAMDNLRPPEVYPQYISQHGIRNTMVDYPHLHKDRRAHYHLHHRQHQQSSMVFPTDSSPLNLEEIVRTVPLPTKISTHDSHPKGTWKWIPDTDDEVRYFNPETKFTQFDFVRHQTVRDRPYSFESSDFYAQQTTPPTGPSSEEGEVHTGRPFLGEIHTGRPFSGEVHTGRPFSEEEEKHDVKALRPPSPWKRILHVMTAAIPLGILISALTPRIVYVHPNATAPTAIPPLSHHQLPPPNLPPSSNLNPPSPLRQRGNLNFNNEINAFLKIMDMQFKERHRGHRMDAKCEDRFFCEVALSGAKHGASRMHKTLYHVALETPQDEAEKSGLSEIFVAIKRQNCNVFKCKKVQ